MRCFDFYKFLHQIEFGKTKKPHERARQIYSGRSESAFYEVNINGQILYFPQSDVFADTSSVNF